MSDPDLEKKLQGFLVQNYPLEAVFISEVHKNVNDMFQRYGVQSDDKDFSVKYLMLEAIKRVETDYRELRVSPYALLFIGGMAKAISDVIINQLIPNMLPKTKKCSTCSTTNNKIAKYCLQCGTKFES